MHPQHPLQRRGSASLCLSHICSMARVRGWWWQEGQGLGRCSATQKPLPKADLGDTSTQCRPCCDDLKRAF